MSASLYTDFRQHSPRVTGGLIRMREEAFKDDAVPAKNKDAPVAEKKPEPKAEEKPSKPAEAPKEEKKKDKEAKE